MISANLSRLYKQAAEPAFRTVVKFITHCHNNCKDDRLRLHEQCGKQIAALNMRMKLHRHLIA